MRWELEDVEEQEADEKGRAKSIKAAFSHRERWQKLRKIHSAMFLKQHGKLEIKMAREVAKVYQGVGNAVSRKLANLSKDATRLVRAKQGEELAGRLLATKVWTPRFMEASRPGLVRGIVFGASAEQDYIQSVKGVRLWEVKAEDMSDEELLRELAAMDDAESLFDQFFVEFPEKVLARMKEHLDKLVSADFWSHIVETIKQTISNQLDVGLRLGESPKELALRVHDAFDGEASLARGMLVARTESTGALNAGHDSVRAEMAEEGIVLGSIWDTTIDGDERPTHNAAHGQKIRAGQMFEVGEEETPYPGWMGLSAGERCNCRCLAMAILDESEFEEGQSSPKNSG